ncbi:MAG: glycosyltransferase family 4 protein [Alphaproteobacteria bacterium]
MNSNVDMPVIMQILPELETGGVERGTIEVATALTKMSWPNIVVSSGGAMVRELDRIGVEHITLPVKTKKPWVINKNAQKLVEIIKEKKVGIVHARSRAPAWSAFKAAQEAGVHFITTFHGTYGLGPWGIKKRYNAVMTKGEKVIAISSFIAEHIKKNYNISEDLIRIVHRGVDTDKFDISRVSAERMIRLAKRWRLPEDAPVIMLPGRLTRWKGQRVLIDAVSKLENKDFRCVLLGSDQGRRSYRRELERLVKSRGLEGVFHIVDNCDDMPAAYMLANIVVSASTDPEAFGRVAIEGQAMGKIVIASAHGGACETIEDGKTGFLVPPANPEALAEKIKEIFAMDSSKRKEISLSAINNAKEIFSTKKMCEGEIAVYQEILKSAQN